MINPIGTAPVVPFVISPESRFSVFSSARAEAYAATDCFKYLLEIPKKIALFFTHRWADFNMFWSAVFSMSPDPQDSKLRILSLHTFIRYLNNPANSRSETLTAFQRMFPSTRALLHYTDSQYVRNYQTVASFEQIEHMREEMIREAEQAIVFQKWLDPISTFLRVLKGVPSAPRSPSGPITAPRPSGLRIPGTIPYDPANVPADVVAKGMEIADLAARFNSMTDAQKNALRARLNIPANQPLHPDYYECLISQDFMEVPVFDSFHPLIKAAFEAATPAESFSLDRGWGHYLDMNSMEGYLNAVGGPKNCPQCRHPQAGGRMERKNLRIDTQLQDQILQFLRTAVN